MVTENDIEFPESPQLIFKVFPEIVALREAGGPGSAPSSYRCSSSDISAWRHKNLSLVVTLSPLNIVKISLSLELDFKVIVPGSAEHVAALVVVRVTEVDVNVLVTDVNRVVVVGEFDDTCASGMH